jgi:membrane protein implicated in regulation of membrane protease activity
MQEYVFIAYLVCFLVGLAYAVIAGLLSGLLGFGHGAEGGVEGGMDSGIDGGIHAGDMGDASFDHDFSAGGAEGHGGGFASGESGGEVALSPWSPMTIAAFVTCFGGVGVILTKMGLPIWFSLPPAAVSGFIVAGGVFLFLVKVFLAVQGSSEASVAGLAGCEAEVITPIPAEGLGEIAYVARGSRFTGPARSESGQPISRHAVVRVVKVVGSTFHVRKVVDEELRGLSAEETSGSAATQTGDESGSP